MLSEENHKGTNKSTSSGKLSFILPHWGWLEQAGSRKIVPAGLQSSSGSAREGKGCTLRAELLGQRVPVGSDQPLFRAPGPALMGGCCRASQLRAPPLPP